MTDEKKRHEITFKRTVYEIPGMDAVTIRRDVSYTPADDSRTMDLYYPPHVCEGMSLPAVLFVAGFPDPGFERFAGCKLKETAGYVSWGQLVAANGLVGITYSNQEPVADLDRVVAYLRQNSTALGIDARRISLWACSGNVPTALGLLMQNREARFSSALLSYGIMLDPDGTIGVAQAALQLGFANPCDGKSVDDLPKEVPLMIVRAGNDQTPRLNDTIDRFVATALVRNLPLTLINHATAPHSFDLLEDSETSYEVIRSMLAFLRFSAA
jgi:hypothetical protein